MSDDAMYAMVLLIVHNIARVRRVLGDPGAGREDHDTALDMLRYAQDDLEAVRIELKARAKS